MPQEKLRPKYTFDRDRVEQLKTIAPEAFADEKINWEVLHEALGEYLESETSETEHFGLSWPGKREARRLASIPSTGTLVPFKGEGIDEDKTHNIFIEGDNLEILKLLQKSYARQVKMIYIDPPYNTGNDFIYNDDFTEPLEQYLRLTGQSDEQGNLLTTNPKSSGRFHSNWLNMMYPRLLLARQLLKEDGVIFVSIDDTEVHNLRVLMSEVFGEEAFISQLIWKSRQQKDNRNVTGASIDHEYILCFGKQIRGDKHRLDQYSNPDNDPRGPWASANMVGLLPEDKRPNCHFDLINPASGINYGKPKLGWRYDKNTITKLIQEKRIIWPASQNGRPRRKVFLNELKNKFTGYSSIIGKDIYTRHGTEEINTMFGSPIIEFPKPSKLMSELIEQGSDKDDIILDFFAGSCSTAHAVIELNHRDKGTRKFIMIQLPEPTKSNSEAAKAGFATIAEVGKERIRRVITDTRLETEKEDLGFRVFKLGRSNYEAWQDYHGEDVNQLEMLFDNAETPLVDDWAPESLLTEVMLIQGFPLDSTIAQQAEFKKNKVQLVVSPTSTHRLFVCFDNQIHDDTIKGLKMNLEDVFVCLDSALTDQTKMCLSNNCTLATI